LENFDTSGVSNSNIAQPSRRQHPSKAEKGEVDKRGAPPGNTYAAKPGQDLKFPIYMSKILRAYFEEWFEMIYGRSAENETELRVVAREIAEKAIKNEIIKEFERRDPGRTTRGSMEVL
jgi:hypothetical protein